MLLRRLENRQTEAVSTGPADHQLTKDNRVTDYCAHLDPHGSPQMVELLRPDWLWGTALEVDIAQAGQVRPEPLFDLDVVGYQYAPASLPALPSTVRWWEATFGDG